MADINDYQKRIAASLDDISKLTYNAELLAAQEARVQLELRTFATGGQGVKDVNGKKISGYVKPKLIQGKRGLKKDKYGTWADKRLDAGLQINNKDLIFTGEFSRSVDLGTSDGKPALGFSNEKGALIAGYQEEREKTKIFQLTDKERDVVSEKIKDFLMKGLKSITDSWR